MMSGSLAEKLRVLRARRGLSLLAASAKLGINRHTLRELELGQGRIPQYPTLARIAQGYDVPVEDLLEVLPTEPDRESGQEPELAAGKDEAPQDTGQAELSLEARTYHEVAGELEEVREGFRAERESFEENISRWEKWRKVGGFSDAHLGEFLLTSESYYLALIGLARDELTAITGVLGLEVGETLPDEAKRESSLLPLVDRFVTLVNDLAAVWDELQGAEDGTEGEAARGAPVHMAELRDRARWRESFAGEAGVAPLLTPRGHQQAG